MSLRIAILGTRGIPNQYGGFEQLTHYLAPALVKAGHTVFVYNCHHHPYKEKTWNGVQIIRCYDPEKIAGATGQFVYDLLCVLDAGRRDFDVILQLGYTSSSVWGHFFPRHPLVIYHLDGMEWQRRKYNSLTRRFLRYAEKLAVKFSDFHITDSRNVQEYFQKKYRIRSEYLAYGADLELKEDPDALAAYGIRAGNYFMLMARMEPENNIEMILDGFTGSSSEKKFLVVGNMQNNFGRQIRKKYAQDERILFAGALFQSDLLHSLRFFSALYFHGHSTGGTNPSLLEAMAGKALVAAHDNCYNREVLDNNALYFSGAGEITQLIENFKRGDAEEKMIAANFANILHRYRWDLIVNQYERFLLQCLYLKRNERNVLYKRYSW